jgi:hypothetical protein
LLHPRNVLPFDVASFTATQLLNLQRSAIRATSAKLGFNRNISRDILYGGLGLFNLVTEQGIAQLQILIRHLRAGTPQGTLFLIGLSWWHLAAGFSFSLWGHPQVQIVYVERTWYTSLQEFLAKINGCLHIPVATFIHWHPLRVNDTAIMEVISALPDISRANLAAFIQCRLFLGILFLSKLVTADGYSIDRDAWLGTRTRHTPFMWPYQPDPGSKSWRIWRRLLATAFLDTHHKRVTKTLHDLILECPPGQLAPWLRLYFF